MIKTADKAGADNSTPSVPQYFSWINNTNEGSTEAQTLINLDFFAMLKREYGMEIKIYAWDAGNFDGASEGYGSVDSEKFISQYPEGYKNVVERARELGIRFGLWGSPDGYGDNEKTEKERFDFFVHLCRDYHFAEFKLDGVCGTLRREKAELFRDMLKECRKYSPDLIVLNHRLELYEAEEYVTTFLWNGMETYVDVLAGNDCTCMHHRSFMFHRGHVPGLERLSEDHGVCISSAVDYFEDELIYQAFNRSLILAPETYGNPWLLRDDELPVLARIYNLHKHNAALLVNGITLDSSYGANAVSRGTKTKRFICTGNDSWQSVKIKIRLDESIGLDTKENILVISRHPYESLIGEYTYGDEVELELPAWRARLIECAVKSEADSVLTGCEYTVIRENADGEPVEVKIVKADGGAVEKLTKGKKTFFMNAEKTDIKQKEPVYLGMLDTTEHFPENGEELYEAAVVAADNDALEARTLRRSGDTKIKEVKAARDAFFKQETYILRGCEAKNMFDGNESTFFDAQSGNYRGEDLREKGGCLRIDFGEEINADSLEIEFFSADKNTREVNIQNIPVRAEYSCSYGGWKAGGAVKTVCEREYAARIVRFTVHTVYELPGRKITVSYPLNDTLRFVRIACPMDRIYAVRLIKNGKDVTPAKPHANNMQAHYSKKRVEVEKHGTFTLPEYKTGSYLAVALDGEHGNELAFCGVKIDGKLYGCPERAPDYKANMWEHRVMDCEKYLTYFYPLPDGLAGREITPYAVFADDDRCDFDCRVYLCQKH
ncbi:MAG: hypothetical protein MJ177_02665 [Clostridia bacterium]|nr:hypothetical protein [Clostridia bacterium]